MLRTSDYASIQTALDLFFVRGFQQQIDRFFDHLLRFFIGPTLTGHAEFRTRRHKPIILAFDTASSLASFIREELPHEPMNPSHAGAIIWSI